VKLHAIILENIKGYRLRKGLTQEAIAAKVKMGASHYARIERGEEGLTIERLEKIAKVLQIDPSILLIPHSYMEGA
jgi:transcriptional regulator with XRE-family HTH domain